MLLGNDLEVCSLQGGDGLLMFFGTSGGKNYHVVRLLTVTVVGIGDG